jgi:hypothetical protein
MEINTVIEVQAFGDFDILYTDSIMVSSEKHDVKGIFSEFYTFMGIKSNTGLRHTILTEIREDFIAFLELKGFSKLKTNPIYFCD